MAGRLNSKPLKIIAATSVTIFSLFACFVGSIAWFQSVRNIKNDASSMPVRPLDGFLKTLSIHPLAEDGLIFNATGDLVSYAFEETATGQYDIDLETGKPVFSGDPVGLGVYDSLNPNNPILLLFELNQPVQASSLKIQAVTENNFMGEIVDGSLVNPLQTSGNFLSSVAQFQSITASSWGSGDYEVSISALSAPVRFANLNADGSELVSWNASPYLYQSDATGTVSYVGIVLDYNIYAMELLYSVNLGNPALDGDFDSPISFTCDWSITV